MVDSFVNVENVRLFTNEHYETERLDRGLAEYERAANQSRMSLLYLNLSQTLVVLVGVTAVLILAARNVESGILTVGGFVTLNTYVLQAFQPLNFLGSIYRQIRQSLIDMESLFDVLEEPTESDATNADRDQGINNYVRRCPLRLRSRTPHSSGCFIDSTTKTDSGHCRRDWMR